jgi:hypothetical protein
MTGIGGHSCPSGHVGDGIAGSSLALRGQLQPKGLGYGVGTIVNAELGFSVGAYRFFTQLEKLCGFSSALPY